LYYYLHQQQQQLDKQQPGQEEDTNTNVESRQLLFNEEEQQEKRDEVFRQRLVEFYSKHNPEQLSTVEEKVVKYRGKEKELFEALEAKYGKQDDEQQEQTQIQSKTETTDIEEVPEQQLQNFSKGWTTTADPLRKITTIEETEVTVIPNDQQQQPVREETNKEIRTVYVSDQQEKQQQPVRKISTQEETNVMIIPNEKPIVINDEKEIHTVYLFPDKS
jgi:hypothetical protein